MSADPLLAAAEATIAKGSKSFALASRLFAPAERERAVLLYAWCRHADDVIDGQVLGQGQVDHGGTSAERLAELEARTRAALEPGACPDDVPFAALARVAATTHMPKRYPLDLIHGFRIDVEERPFATFDDTLAYCYHVAGCVGVMMAIAMGVAPDDRATLDRASDLGIAFQLNNIARDVIEDAANRRRYIPDDWLANVGLEPRSFAFPPNRRQLARLVARLVNAAEEYGASAQFGTSALPWRAAWAVLAADDIYGGIGRRVRDLGAAGLDARVHTSTAAKLGAITRTLPLALSRSRRWPPPGPSRDGLWSFPH